MGYPGFRDTLEADTRQVPGYFGGFPAALELSELFVLVVRIMLIASVLLPLTVTDPVTATTCAISIRTQPIMIILTWIVVISMTARAIGQVCRGRPTDSCGIPQVTSSTT